MDDSLSIDAACADPFCRFVCLQALIDTVHPDLMFPIEDGWAVLLGEATSHGATLVEALLEHVRADS